MINSPSKTAWCFGQCAEKCLFKLLTFQSPDFTLLHTYLLLCYFYMFNILTNVIYMVIIPRAFYILQENDVTRFARVLVGHNVKRGTLSNP